MCATNSQDERTRKAIGGDELALTLLLLDDKHAIRGYLASKLPADLRGIIEADDLVQETHVEVYRRIRSFEPEGPDAFGRWMRTIAIRRLRDAIRPHRRAKRGGGRQPAALNGGAREDSMIALIDMLAAPGKTPSRMVARDEAV